MALKIKPIPKLKGKSAERFISLMEENAGNKISSEREKQIKNLINKVLSN